MLNQNLPEAVKQISDKLPNGVYLELEENLVANNLYGDGLVNIRMKNGDTYTFMAEVKNLYRKESLNNIIKQMEYPSHLPRLLLCNPISHTLADLCEKHGLSFIDGAGNARIHVPGLHFVREGLEDRGGFYSVKNSQSKITEGTLKLLFVLLAQPDTINLTYRSLAEMAGISLGMVSKAFEYLKNQRDYRDSKDGRRLTDREKLMALWLREYSTTLKPKLKSLRVEEPTDWTQLELKQGDIWGGEVSANLLSDGYLIPENMQLFTNTPLLQRSAELGLRKNSQGKFWLTSAFWGDSLELNRTGKVMLCIAELIASNDDRNIETARMINEKYLNLKETAISGY
jgi:hypothetical protein